MGAVGTSLYVTRALYVLRGLVSARFLGPADYGVWGTLSILLNYSNAAPLGSAEAVSREVPFYAQRRDQARVREVKEQSFSFNLYVSLLASFLVLAYAYLRRESLEPIFFVGLHVAAGGMTLQQLYFYYRIVLRAEKRFWFQSQTEILFALLNVPLTIILVIVYRLQGLYASYLLGHAALVVFLIVRVPIRLRWPVNRPLVADLIRIGFPAYLLGLVYTIFMSVDRMVIAGYLTPADMGYYTISFTLIQALGEVPVIVAQVMSPNLVERYSHSGSVSGVYSHVRVPTLTIATFFPALQVGAMLSLVYILHYVLPKFLPGLPAIEILLFGGFFVAVMRGSSSLLLALRKQGTAVAIYGICIALAFALNLLFVKGGMGLVGVALATALAYLALYLMYQAHVFRFFYGRRLGEHLRLHARVLLPFVYGLGIYAGLERLLPFAGDAMLADAARLILKLAIVVLLYMPLAVLFVREVGVWQDLEARFPWLAAWARRGPKV